MPLKITLLGNLLSGSIFSISISISSRLKGRKYYEMNQPCIAASDLNLFKSILFFYFWERNRLLIQSFIQISKQQLHGIGTIADLNITECFKTGCLSFCFLWKHPWCLHMGYVSLLGFHDLVYIRILQSNFAEQFCRREHEMKVVKFVRSHGYFYRLARKLFFSQTPPFFWLTTSQAARLISNFYLLAPWETSFAFNL